MTSQYEARDAGKARGGVVHVFQSSPAPQAVVVYIHGFHSTLVYGKYPDYWQLYRKKGQFRLEAQFLASGLPATFIIPHAAENSKVPKNLYWPDLAELIQFAGAPADLPVMLVGHSGAWRHYLSWLGHARVRHLALLDSLYFQRIKAPLIVDWMKRPGVSLDVFACDKNTFGNGRYLMTLLEQSGHTVQHLASLPTSQTQMPSDAERRASINYVEQRHPHYEVVTEGRVIPWTLRRPILEGANT